MYIGPWQEYQLSLSVRKQERRSPGKSRSLSVSKKCHKQVHHDERKQDESEVGLKGESRRQPGQKKSIQRRQGKGSLGFDAQHCRDRTCDDHFLKAQMIDKGSSDTPEIMELFRGKAKCKSAVFRDHILARSEKEGTTQTKLKHELKKIGKMKEAYLLQRVNERSIRLGFPKEELKDLSARHPELFLLARCGTGDCSCLELSRMLDSEREQGGSEESKGLTGTEREEQTGRCFDENLGLKVEVNDAEIEKLLNWSHCL